MIDPIVSFIPSVLYGLAAVFISLDLWRRATPLRYVALILISLAIITRIATFLQPALCPVAGAGGGMGILAMFLALHVVFGFRSEGKDQARALLLTLIIFGLDLGGQVVQPEGEPLRPPQVERAVGELHGGLVLLSYAALTVAGVYGLLYLILYRLMKKRRVGFLFSRLPSLDRLEKKAAVANVVGLVTLTLGLGVGVIGFSYLRGGIPYTDAKFVIALLLWLLFAFESIVRRFYGWNGIRVMWIPLFGSLLIIVLYSLSHTEHPFWSPG